MSATGFYVTVRDGVRTGFLLGPYDTHEEALGNVARGSAAARDVDDRAAFYAYGTTKVTAGRLPEGSLNARIGVTA